MFRMIYLEFLFHNICTVKGLDGKQTGEMTYSNVYELYCNLQHQLGSQSRQPSF